MPDDIPKKVGKTLDLRLNQINIYIIDNKLLGQKYCNAFLSTTIPCNHDNKQKYLIIQARLLLIGFKLNGLKGYKNFIKNAFREFRLLIKRKNWDALNKLPDFNLPIKMLIGELNVIIEGLPEGEKNLFSSLQSLLTRYEKNVLEYKKRKVEYRNNLEDTKVDVSHPLRIVDSNILHDDFESTYSNFLPDSPILTTQEKFADQPPIERYLSIELATPNVFKKTLTLQVIAAKTVMNQIQRRERLLITDISHLTKYDVSILIHHCISNIEKSPHYSCLLVMLLTGKNLEDSLTSIQSTSFTKSTPFNESAVFVFNPELPSHDVESKIENLLTRPTAAVIQALPLGIRNSIIQFKNQFNDLNYISDKIKTTIRRLNHKKSTNLTMNRISNHLIFTLKNDGVDSTEIILVLGRGLRQEAGTYYYQVNSGKILSIHQNYMQKLLKLAGYKYKAIRSISNSNLGTRLMVKDEKVKLLFDLLSRRLDEYRNSGWKFIEDFHNIYTIYCIEILNLATGYRAVRHPYENINKFDLYAKTIFISDKEERSELSARVICLPDVVVSQVKLYLEHLKNIEGELRNISNETADAVRSARVGDAPIFFFLNGSEIEPVIPKTLSARLEEIFPLPPNWHRHYMRSWMRKNHISGQLVNAWMGHLSFGSAGFSKYSGNALADMRKISEKINVLLIKDFGIRLVNPWGRKK